jgi:hypothetical protein
MAELGALAGDSEPDSSFGIANVRVNRDPFSDQIAGAFFPQLRAIKDGFRIRDKQAVYRERPFFKGAIDFEEHTDGGWKVSTNNMGFRKSVNVLRKQPELRIIATGDSHTAGVVPNHE